MIRVVCQSCGATLKAMDELARPAGKCPTCGRPASVPEPEQATPSADELTPIPFDSLEDDESPPAVVISQGKGSLGSIAPDPAEEGSSAASSPTSARPQSHRLFVKGSVPAQLGPLNHHLICDHKDVIARWENDGKGWMIRMAGGFTPVATVSAEIPQSGAFVLI